MKHLTLYSICLFFIAACNQKQKTVFKDKNEMLVYLSDPANGLAKEADVPKPLTMAMRFQPYQLLPGYHDGDSTLKNHLYFVLSFSVNGKELLSQLPQEQYSSLLQTFSFGMQSYISAGSETGGKLEPEGVFFNPTYGAAKANNLLLVFNRAESLKGKQLHIVVEDPGLGFGGQEFTFSTDQLKQGLQFHLSSRD